MFPSEAPLNTDRPFSSAYLFAKDPMFCVHNLSLLLKEMRRKWRQGSRHVTWKLRLECFRVLPIGCSKCISRENKRTIS